LSAQFLSAGERPDPADAPKAARHGVFLSESGVERKGERSENMKSSHDYLIVTNNPLVARCMGGAYQIQFFEGLSYREILVKVRDLVYAGHTLYTHPLAGSVKPNETPYRSVLISLTPHTMAFDQAEMISNSIEAFDKFTPRNRTLSEKVLRDFQLIDYTLLAGALDFDAAAGLSKEPNYHE
jgi:hypothetical protein